MSAERTLESRENVPFTARSAVQVADRLNTTNQGVERPNSLHDALVTFSRAYDEIRDLGLYGEHAHSLENLFVSAGYIASHAGERDFAIRNIVNDLRENMGAPPPFT